MWASDSPLPFVTIAAAVEEMKEDVVSDVQKELRDMLKNAFKGSKNIRIT